MTTCNSKIMWPDIFPRAERAKTGIKQNSKRQNLEEWVVLIWYKWYTLTASNTTKNTCDQQQNVDPTARPAAFKCTNPECSDTDPPLLVLLSVHYDHLALREGQFVWVVCYTVIHGFYSLRPLLLKDKDIYLTYSLEFCSSYSLPILMLKN